MQSDREEGIIDAILPIFLSRAPKLLKLLLSFFLLDWFLTFLLIHAKRGSFEAFLRDVVRTITTTGALILIASGSVLVSTAASASASTTSVVIVSAGSSPTTDLRRNLLRSDDSCRSS